MTIRCRIGDASGVEIALALAATAALVALALARRRAARRRVPLGGLGGQLTDDEGRQRHTDQQALDLENGALDPDELESEPAVWDEGADDEVR